MSDRPSRQEQYEIACVTRDACERCQVVLESIKEEAPYCISAGPGLESWVQWISEVNPSPAAWAHGKAASVAIGNAGFSAESDGLRFPEAIHRDMSEGLDGTFYALGRMEESGAGLDQAEHVLQLISEARAYRKEALNAISPMLGVYGVF